MIRRVGMAYFGGAVGALVSSVALWLAGRAALTAMLGVAISPTLSVAWIEPRILEGGLWGLAYPFLLRRGLPAVRAGLLLSLAPSLAQLFWALPRAGQLMLGVGLGPLTPVVVLIENAIWGWTLARIVIAAGESGSAGSKG
jgi:hypothetical protein